MRYGSVCSGIESASVAWESIGWSPAWFSEIEAFPSAVLAYHWPHVENLGDMCNLPIMLDIGLVEAPDVLVGGTPCQSFSVAGSRGGLTDDRGLLTLKYIEVANAIDRQRGEGNECVVVWENVPGVLSSKDNAFGHFLAGLVGKNEPLQPPGKKWLNTGCVYGPQRQLAWRVLDAQYFGVAQRRRRVFVVASGRDGFSPAEVLFEFEGVRRDTPPSRETGEGASGFTPSSFGNYSEQLGTLRAEGGDYGGGGECIIMAHGQGGAEINSEGKSPTLTCNHEAPIVCHGTQDPCVSDRAFALGRNGGRENVLAFQQNASGEVRTGRTAYTLNTNSNASGRNTGMVVVPKGVILHGSDKTVKTASFTEIAGSLKARPPGGIENSSTTVIHHGLLIRRLTPRECERLQGFPDDYTLIPWKLYQECERKGLSFESELIKRGCIVEDCPDGPRYKAIGNSKAVPVIKWIGERINAQTVKTR